MTKKRMTKPQQLRPEQAQVEVEDCLSDLYEDLPEGTGPLRFGPVPTYGVTIQDQLMQLVSQQKQISKRKTKNPADVPDEQVVLDFAHVSAQWEMSNTKGKKFTQEQILRCFLFCNYDQQKTITLLKKTDPGRFNLAASRLKEQLLSKTLFPLPGLKYRKTKFAEGGSKVFYMRPSRYDPRKTPTSMIIDNLVYAMDTLSRTQPLGSQGRGIAFIANMDGWKMDQHFSVNYCLQFMLTLQGKRFPAKVDMFLIVDPPNWFDKTWTIMKAMLSPTFQRKVHMIPQKDLGKYLQKGYERYLPDELETGKCPTEDLVKDFVSYQYEMEGAMGQQGYGPMTVTAQVEAAKAAAAAKKKGHKQEDEEDEMEGVSLSSHSLSTTRSNTVSCGDDKHKSFRGKVGGWLGGGKKQLPSKKSNSLAVVDSTEQSSSSSGADAEFDVVGTLATYQQRSKLPRSA
eukprot:CAMPEP_0113457488 /NCGR_PEP_ID=MMETSP0014_2-20120614/9436_1 /TAXON_ID=2857 /ORGANISM="Nitzschia sp." /LENGTH=453 /DNA_ID=CAMNT_0000348989 /DNA_START=134 /DNA_END=1495 /DNA_ORIENTATION=- /assembly_acc=CAM_ASM_000159